MCCSVLQAAVRARGLATRVCFCPLASAAGVLKSVLPFGKVALIAGEECFALGQTVRAALRGFTVYSNVLGAGDGAAGLFSLPDDVRAAVGVGARGIAAARCFATLRGAYSLAVPAGPTARGIFEERVPAGYGHYPARPADLVLFDGERGEGCAEALAETSLAAQFAEDVEIDAVFAGRRRPHGFRRAAELLADAAEKLAAGAAEKNGVREALFAASALYFLEKRGAPPFPAEEAARLLAKRTGRPAALCALPACLYFAQRSERLFGFAKPRPYFVPDYCARLARAAEECGEERSVFRNVRVPSGEEHFRLHEIFAQARGRLGRSARLASDAAAKLSRAYFAAGGERPSVPAGLMPALYDLSAELSPLWSAPALERELGLLPNPRAEETILFAGR